MMHYQNDSGGGRLVGLMQHTNLVAASTHHPSPKSQPLGQATYTKNGLPSQIDYILCSKGAHEQYGEVQSTMEPIARRMHMQRK